MHFQPKFRLQRSAARRASRRCCAGATRSTATVSPTRFIEIAEDSGLIIELGSWVIRAACRQLREWLDCGLRRAGGDQCFRQGAAARRSGAGRSRSRPPRPVCPTSLIEVEITESLLVKDSAKVRDALERLRQLGCRIALDDFGTGYSSLAYITRFPPDRIKIDKAFVHNVDHSASDAAIANAILSLGQSLDIVVTAEGIERPGQLEWLRTRGCHEVQGFLLSKPLSAAELEQRFLDSRMTLTDELRCLPAAKFAV